MKPFLSLLLFCTVLSSLLSAQNIDGEASKVSFKIKNLGSWVDGTLSNPSGKIIWDDSNLGNCSISASIKTESIDTGIGMRDNHLKEEKYFDVDNYPQITFRSSSISQTSTGFEAVGLLVIKGEKKEVKIPFEVIEDGKVFKGDFQIDRRDFDVGGGSLVLSDDVLIHFELHLK